MSAPYYRKYNKKPHSIDSAYKPNASDEVLNKPIDQIGLNPKTLEILQTGKIKNILDIAVRTEKDLYRIQGFSKKSLFDIKRVLASYNLDVKIDVNSEVSSNEQDIVKQESFELQQIKNINSQDNRQVNRQDNRQVKQDIRQGNRQENHTATNPDSRNNRVINSPDNRNNRVNTNLENKNNKNINNNNQNVVKNDNRIVDNKNINKTPAQTPIFRNAKGEIIFNDKRENSERKLNNGFRNQTEQKPQIQKEQPNELRKFSVNGKFGYKNSRGIIVIPAVYTEIAPFKEDLACVELNDFFGYIDKNNKVIIPCEKYECAMSFSDGLACVTLNGKCGYINKSGETVIDYKYDAGTAFENGFARVKADGKWGTVDKLGAVKWAK